MPKIRKIKEIPSKIKIIEKEKNSSELESEIKQDELENFAEFIQSSSSSNLDDITPILKQGEIQRIIDGTEQSESSRDEINSTAAAQSYGGARRATYSERSSSTYNPSIRADETTTTITPTLEQSDIGRPLIAGQSLGAEQQLMRALEGERRGQYERPQEGGARATRRSRPQEGR